MLFKEIVDARTDGRRTPDIGGSQKLTEHFVGFFYSIGAITLFTFKALGQAELKLLAIYGFYFSGPCALDLSPTDPKINGSPLLNKVIHYK